MRLHSVSRKILAWGRWAARQASGAAAREPGGGEQSILPCSQGVWEREADNVRWNIRRASCHLHQARLFDQYADDDGECKGTNLRMLRPDSCRKAEEPRSNTGNGCNQGCSQGAIHGSLHVIASFTHLTYASRFSLVPKRRLCFTSSRSNRIPPPGGCLRPDRPPPQLAWSAQGRG